jgi:hypothetical protein
MLVMSAINYIDDQYDPKHGLRLVIGPPLPAQSGSTQRGQSV